MLIGAWIRRLGYLIGRRRLEDELRREMEAHLAEMGEPLTFGNMLQLREEARDAWGWRWLDDLARDTRFAWRLLRHSPVFAVTAIVTLALSIGVNVAMLSLINGVLLRPLHAEDVVAVQRRGPAPASGSRGVSFQALSDIREQALEVLDSAAGFTMGFVGLDAGRGTREALAHTVTADYFRVFDTPLVLGRPFNLEEARPGASIRVAIVSHQLWTQLGGDRDALGQTIRVHGEDFGIVGVAREGFSGTSIPGPEIWLPIGAQGPRPLTMVGRLQQGMSIETAREMIAAIGRRLEQAEPSEHAGYTLGLSKPSGRLLFMPGAENAGRTAGLAVLLMLLPAVVLTVACLNLANLLQARGHMRLQELAVRVSLGGGRFRLLRQLLTETSFLVLIGGVVGFWLSTLAIDVLLVSLRAVLPLAVGLPDTGPDWRVVAGTMSCCLVATVVSGVWPAWRQTRRVAAPDLKRSSGIERRRRGGISIGRVMVVGQVALSLMLLASGGLVLVRSLSETTADPGFQFDTGVLVHVDPDLGGYDELQGNQTHRALLDRLGILPGVEAVSIASRPPFSSSGASRRVAPHATPLAGEPSKPRSSSVSAVFSVIGRDYARVLGLPMLAGRDFTGSELSSDAGPPVAIVDGALARELWPGEQALGRTIQFLDAGGGATTEAILVVGVMPATRHSISQPQDYPHVYVPLGQHYESDMTVLLRMAEGLDEPTTLATVARAVREVDDRLPVVSVATWRQHLAASFDVWVRRVAAALCAAFGGVALLLAIIGVYGVKSYLVSRRMREFGIRIAIGAPPRALVWQVLREDGGLTAVGLAVGVLLALAAGRSLQSVLRGVSVVEPLVLTVASLVLVGASLAASLVPALRAGRVNPTVALRSE